MTKIRKKNKTKTKKNNEQGNLISGVQPQDQSLRQNQTMMESVEDSLRFSEKVSFKLCSNEGR